jgi:excisionase family DNA binding protein
MDYNFEPLVDAKEIGKLLGLHPKTVQKMAREGKIPSVPVGRFRKYRKSEVDRSLRSEVHCACYACRQNEEEKS